MGPGNFLPGQGVLRPPTVIGNSAREMSQPERRRQTLRCIRRKKPASIAEAGLFKECEVASGSAAFFLFYLCRHALDLVDQSLG